MTLIDCADLTTRAKLMGISLNTTQLDKFQRFAALLSEWNEKMNLTAVPPENYIERHFLDSLSLATLAEWTGRGSLADIGTGAGFPGIPLKIAFPEIDLVLVESLNKRCVFLKTVIQELNLTQVNIITERGEIVAHHKKLRSSFDFVTARAVADLSILCEVLIPLARIGGIVAPLKSSQVDDEIRLAKKIAPICGGEVVRVHDYQIPNSDRHLSIPVIKKVLPSEERFPRNYSAIQKKPLC